MAGIPGFFDLPMLKPQVRIVTAEPRPDQPGGHRPLPGRRRICGRATRADDDAGGGDRRGQRSGLRGRGGAGFPTGRSGALPARRPAHPKYMICNADEGDPGAFMDRSILEGDPHAVLEGMIIAAYAIGAIEGYHLRPRRVSAGGPTLDARPGNRPRDGLAGRKYPRLRISASISRSRRAPAPSSAAKRPR